MTIVVRRVPMEHVQDTADFDAAMTGEEELGL